MGVVLGAALASFVCAGAAAVAMVAAAASVPATSAPGTSLPGHDHPPPVVLAPGYADLSFVPPAAGSYRLPSLGLAADGPMLDSAGRDLQLHDLMGDRMIVLSFIYTRCGDVNGCPLATHVFARVAEVLSRSGDLADRVRLISLSFDPDFDTPAVMDRHGRRYQRAGVDWWFLTTRSVADLKPVLEAYDQWVIRDVDAEGNALGSMSHVLRVYLIDRDLKIRNIYSVSYLHADTIANDLRTLLLRRAGESDLD